MRSSIAWRKESGEGKGYVVRSVPRSCQAASVADRRGNGQRDERTSAENVLLYLKDMRTNEVKILEVLVLLQRRQQKKEHKKRDAFSWLLRFFTTFNCASLSPCLLWYWATIVNQLTCQTNTLVAFVFISSYVKQVRLFIKRFPISN